MKTLDLEKMHEAARLTRAGRLSDALALLQAATMSPTTGTTSAEGTIDGEIVSDQIRPTKLSAAIPQLLGSFDGANLPGARRHALHTADIAPEGGRYVSGSFSNAEGARSYKLYIPTICAAGPRPLIVMLHGCTQSADDFAAGTRMNFVAEEHGCFVVYPEQPQAANASKCWNWFRSADQARGKGEPSLIAGITRQVVEEHGIDQARIYVAGLSAGGAAAAIMGEAYPDLYAAVGVHSGLACGSANDVASAFNAMRGGGGNTGSGAPAAAKPTIVFHGDRDATVHPSNGAKVIARVAGDANFRMRTERKTSSQGYSFSHAVHRDASGLSILELWELHGAGHSWSGGSPAGSFTSQDGPDASKEMLRFFLQHRRTLP
ncbi:PHB depolymerase family esterase [Hyphomicrobium sp. 99]|uniref:extracellular catalytic domain type 1 short-chain-length polyhydroxyalkanoate depolymerase n=1 Tax=Hyphomicrobium sp. 99 TaxID=1163419 RepID=UPI0005F860F3|nr:PHB depolymerase family esterase [Hyphomicrobium sp. 99]